MKPSISSPKSAQIAKLSNYHQNHIALDLDDLPSPAKAYIMEVTSAVISYLGVKNIKGIMLFGSLVVGGHNINSDVDLLIIVSNNIPFHRIKKIHHLLQTFELKHGYILPPSNLIERILQVVERRTGMFCSHFICREEDWVTERFDKILSVNRAAAWLLAPEQIVLDSLKKGARVLYGDVDLSVRTEQYSLLQMLKSLAMTLVLSYGAILVIPFQQKFSKYLIEAYKWALRASFFYIFQRVTKLSEICDYFMQHGLSQKYIQMFRFYRKKSYSGYHIRFCLQVPFEIMKLHRLAFQIKHFSKKSSTI